MRFEKHAFNARVEKPAFYLEKRYAYILQPMHLNGFFSTRTLNAHSGKRMFYKTPVLRTLLDVRKTCVNERTLNMRYSIYMFTMY